MTYFVVFAARTPARAMGIVRKQVPPARRLKLPKPWPPRMDRDNSRLPRCFGGRHRQAFTRLGCSLGTALALSSLAGAAQTERLASDEQCFDALVSARVVRQVPSVVPETVGSEMAISSWPFFIDLDVVRVLEGEAPVGRSTMLSVQHNYWRKGLGVRKWWLRRNTLGGFNILLEENTEALALCPENSGAAVPYISPGEGRTLQDVLRDGKDRYGERP